MTLLHPPDKSHPTKVEHHQFYVTSFANLNLLHFTLNNTQKTGLP